MRVGFLVLIVVFTLAVAPTPPRVNVSAPVAVGGGLGGDVDGEFLLWSDPADAQRLMACGEVEYGTRDVGYGYVFVSSDGGATWKRALVDDSTAWVSEESCAFGPDNTAYFAAGAAPSDIMSGLEWGHLQVFVSTDRAATWHMMYVRPQGWVDWTFIAPAGGLTGNSSLVLFGNDATDRVGHWTKRARPVVLASDDGGQHFRPLVHAQPAEFGSAFASGAAELPDGTRLFLASASLKGARDVQSSLGWSPELFSFSPRNGSTLEARARITNVKRPNNAWSARLVRFGHTLYAAWTSSGPYSSSLSFAVSSDWGRHWRARVLARGGGEVEGRCTHPTAPTISDVALATDPDGTVALAWVEAPSTVRLAVSYDGGRTFTQIALPQRTETASASEERLNWSVPFDEHFYDEGLDAMLGRSRDESHDLDFQSLGLSVRLTRGDPITVVGLAGGSPGIFHLVWGQHTSRGMPLWARTIRLEPGIYHGSATLEPSLAESSCAKISLGPGKPRGTEGPVRLAGLENVGVSFHIFYPIRAEFDAATHTVVTGISLVNKTKEHIQGTFILVAAGLHSDYGRPRATNARGTVDGMPFWSLRGTFPSLGLAPGQRTSTLPMEFQILHFEQLTLDGDAVAMHLRIYKVVRP